MSFTESVQAVALLSFRIATMSGPGPTLTTRFAMIKTAAAAYPGIQSRKITITVITVRRGAVPLRMTTDRILKTTDPIPGIRGTTTAVMKITAVQVPRILLPEAVARVLVRVPIAARAAAVEEAEINL